MTALMVQKPHISEAGIMTMQPYKLDVQVWNSAYNFCDVIRRVNPDDRRFRDPAYLVLQAPMHFVVKRFDHLIISQLANICTYHAISSKGLRKDVIVSRLLAHSCNVSCGSLLYAFRLTTRLRPLKPWIQGRAERLPAISQTPSTSKAIPNTTGQIGRAIATIAGRLQTSSHHVDGGGAPTSKLLPATTDSSPDQSTFSESRVGSIATSTMGAHTSTSWSASRALRAALSRSASSTLHDITRDQTSHPQQLTGDATDSQSERPKPHRIAGTNSRTATREEGMDELTPHDHLEVTPESTKRAIILEWQKVMSLERFIKRVCAICSTLVIPEEIKQVPSSNLDLTLLQNDELPPSVIPTNYNFAAYDRAILDPQALFGNENSRSARALMGASAARRQIISLVRRVAPTVLAMTKPKNTKGKTASKAQQTRVTWDSASIKAWLELMAEKRSAAGDGGSFKMSVHNDVAIKLNQKLGLKGKKVFSGKSLWNKWKKFRPIQQAIGIIINKSGWPSYTLEGGANITPELGPAWDTFIATHPAAEPYRNVGWEWYDMMCEVVPVKVTGQNVYHPGGDSDNESEKDASPTPSTPSRHSLPAIPSVPLSPAAQAIDSEDEVEVGELPQPVAHKKRKAAATGNPKAKRAHNGTKGRASAASFLEQATEEMKRMNDSMETFLNGSGDGSGGKVHGTPARRHAAIMRAQELEDWLGTMDLVTLIGIFKRDIAAADVYMAIKREDVRKTWVENEIEQANAKDHL